MTLASLLQEKGIKFEKHQHPKSYTAQELAHEEHVSGYMVAKPVIVKAGSKFSMCVLAAPNHLDLDAVSDVLKETDVRLATESELLDLCPGCELGAEPPVGSLFGMATIMDVGLEQDDFLVMQAGSHTEAIKIRREDWEQIAEPLKASITLH